MSYFNLSDDTASTTYSINGVGEVKMLPFEGVMNPSPFSIFLGNSLKISEESIAIDMGCGSGILSITLAKLGIKKVLAVDIDDNSIKATTLNAQTNGITVGSTGTILPIKSDLFQSLISYEHCIDLIVSNPPTLATIPPIPCYYQAGNDGRSFIDKLILESPNFLTQNGCLQFTHPFHAGIKKTEKLLQKVGFKYEIIDCKPISFHSFHKYHFQYLEQLGLLEDLNYKFDDKQNVAIFRAKLA